MLLHLALGGGYQSCTLCSQCTCEGLRSWQNDALLGFSSLPHNAHMLLVGLVCLHLANTVALLEEAFHLWLLLAFVVVMIHGISDSVLCTSGVKHCQCSGTLVDGSLPFEHCNTISLFMSSGINVLWAGGGTTFTKLVYFLKIRIRVAKILSF